MAFKSTDKKYGMIAITIHWLAFILVAILIISGNIMDDLINSDDRMEILQFHAPIGLSIGALFILRIIWWIFFDKKPPTAENDARWQQIASHLVHYSFYIVILLLVGSGIAMMILSGAGAVISGEVAGPLPNFDDFAPRAPHGIFAKILVALVILHAAAALYHQFFKKDGLLRRMWY